MTTLADESLTLTGPDAERSYTINDIKMKLKCPFGKHSTKTKKKGAINKQFAVFGKNALPQ